LERYFVFGMWILALSRDSNEYGSIRIRNPAFGIMIMTYYLGAHYRCLHQHLFEEAEMEPGPSRHETNQPL